jgi:hypothetical protein
VNGLVPAILAADSGGNGDSIPAWVSILVAFVGSSLLGGLAGAWMQGRAHKREQWTTRLLTAADEFLESVLAAAQGLEDVLNDVWGSHGGELRDEIDLSPRQRDLLNTVDPLVTAASRDLARVHLLFGPESEAGKAARLAVAKLRRSFSDLQGEPDYPLSDAHRANEALSEARVAANSFVESARESAVKGKP